MWERVKQTLMPYRMLAGLLALVLTGSLVWYGAVFLLAGRSGVRLEDLSGERRALQGVTLTGHMQDPVFDLAFTVTGEGVQNRFSALDGGAEYWDDFGRSLYFSIQAAPAPGAEASEPVLVPDENGRMHYEFTADEVAYSLTAWGQEGREMVLLDTGVRLRASGAQYRFCSQSLLIGEGGPMIWGLTNPGSTGWSQTNQDAYDEASDLARRLNARMTRAGQRDLLLLDTGEETVVYRIEQWGSTLDWQHKALGEFTFIDYTQPVGRVQEAARLPGALCAAAPVGQHAAAVLIQNEAGLTACALNETGALTDQALLLSAGETGSHCAVSPVTATENRGFADVGLLIEPDAPGAAAAITEAEVASTVPEEPEIGEIGEPEEPERTPWAAALRIENGRFTAKELLPLSGAPLASRFLAAGLDETGTRLVTVQQLLPTRAEQPPEGVRGATFHLAGDVSVAVWQQGEALYEGILACDWKEDTWRRSHAFGGYGRTERFFAFGGATPYGTYRTRARSTLSTWEEEVVYR